MRGVEYEVKVPVEDLGEVRERLEGLGASISARVIEEDYYVDLRKCPGFPEGAALRIRKSKNLTSGKVTGKITFKRVGEEAGVNAKVRVEIESGVDDPDALIQAFTQMGFTVYRVKKERTIYRLLNDVTVTLDSVEGLGKFVEVEIMNPASSEYYNKKLKEVLRDLGLTDRKLITKPYIEMLIEG